MLFKIIDKEKQQKMKIIDFKYNLVQGTIIFE